MSEHEQVRKLIALAAAGALGAAEQARVEQHARGCVECSREFEAWRVYALALRVMPEPVVPLGLVERTLTRLREERETATERRRNAVVLGGLAVFGWATSAAGWIVVREVAPIGFAAWSAGWMAVGWITAGVAAVMLGKHQDRRWGI